MTVTKSTLAVALLAGAVCTAIGLAQHGGNAAYSEAGGRAGILQREREMRKVEKDEQPPSATTSYVDAHVLHNVKADRYVVTYGIAHEGKTLAECSQKMDETVSAFRKSLAELGVAEEDVYVDFITQNRIYGYEVKGDILQEGLEGFEFKKNVIINYEDDALLDKLTLAAAEHKIYDLIKVDYIVSDLAAVQDKLMDEASAVVKRKVSRYEKLLGVKLRAPAQVIAEKSAVHYPTRMYDSYQAHEAQNVQANYSQRNRYTVVNARKSRTFYFNALDGDGYDKVVNPVVTEPVVQCTLYLKMKYEVEQNKPQ